jgi:hypothetical protein
LIKKTGQKVSWKKFVRTIGHNTEIKDNPVKNRTYGHPKLNKNFNKLL